MAPPRAVPLGVRMNALFGGGLAVIGWGLLLFATPFFWIFAVNADVVAPIVLSASAAQATGVITAIDATRASEGKRSIYRVQYSFQVPAGPKMTGTSYVTGTAPVVGETRPVEYVPALPGFSRIVGMRRAMFGPGGIIVLVFPAIAAAIVAFELRSGRRVLRLLRHGKVASATFVSQQRAHIKVNKRDVLELTFEYAGSDGLRRTFTETTTDPGKLRDERRETILYLPDDDESATTVDALPVGVTADERGEIAAGPGPRILVLALPLLVILINGSCVVNYLR
ncbi:MAG: DUF3592 domain-containing protein [Vicinamibacteria bacterium]